MQRFINDPDFVVDDTVRGFVKAHKDLVKLGENPRVVAYAEAPIRGKVGVITGGGSGTGISALPLYEPFSYSAGNLTAA